MKSSQRALKSGSFSFPNRAKPIMVLNNWPMHQLPVFATLCLCIYQLSGLQWARRASTVKTDKTVHGVVEVMPEDLGLEAAGALLIGTSSRRTQERACTNCLKFSPMYFSPMYLIPTWNRLPANVAEACSPGPALVSC